MSRKDFELIARTLREIRASEHKRTHGMEYAVWAASTDSINAVVNAFADALRTTNCNFKREKFLAVCAIA